MYGLWSLSVGCCSYIDWDTTIDNTGDQSHEEVGIVFPWWMLRSKRTFVRFYWLLQCDFVTMTD